MKLKKIEIANFRNIESLAVDFTDETFICGKNKTGKSTVRDAVLWVLQNKLADGSAANNIRPKDASGKDIDYLVIKVGLYLENDGNEYYLLKTQEQKWVTKRGDSEARFNGNENKYEINGIPKKEKDFTAFIESIVDADTLIYGMNANAFLSMETKKRRQKLLSLEPDFSDADVVALDPEFKEIESDLNVGTVDELLSREKKAKKEYTEQLKSIPIRIDEIAMQKIEIDSATLAENKKGIEKQIKAFEKKRVECAKKADEFNKMRDRIMQIAFEQNAIAQEMNKGNAKKRRDITLRMDTLKSNAYSQKLEISNIKNQIDSKKNRIAAIDADGARLNDRFKEINAETFDNSKKTCPTCGQELPVRVLKDAKRNWMEEKGDRLTKITMDAKNLKREKIALGAEVNDLDVKLDELEMSLKVGKSELESLEKQLAELPADEKPETNDAWLALRDEKVALETKLENANKETDTSRIDEALSRAWDEIKLIDAQLAKASKNDEIDSRIDYLNNERIEVSQAIANTERKIDILERFNKAKIELLTDKVNQHFKVIKWQMFEPQINGGYAMVCNPTVGGISYFGGLNHGDRLLADIDLCCAWQDASRVCLPVFLDDAESVDPDRIPKLDRQLIVLRRTDDDALTVRQAGD